MPTYHYVCRKCGHDFEYYQSIKDEALKTCPKERCARSPWAKGRVDRQLSGGAGLLFKGSGFYTTDYRSEGYKQAAKKDSDAAAPAKTDATPKTDAKTSKPPAPTPAAATPKPPKD
jgi:putative FmdB family regulatory protein